MHEPHGERHPTDAAPPVPDRSRSSRLLVGAAAAAYIALIAAIAALTVWDRPDEERVAIQPPPTRETTITDTATPTTERETIEPSRIPEPVSELVIDPIDMGPTPPPREARPDTIVAVLEDGWLATVDTATGEVLERHLERGDLREEAPEGPRYGIWQVAVAANGEDVWYSFCCEPAAGATRRLHSDPALDLPGLQADAPTFTMTSTWLTGASYVVPLLNVESGAHRWWGSDSHPGFIAAVITPGGQRLVAQPWPHRDDIGRVTSNSPMVLVRTDTVLRTTGWQGGTQDQIVDDEPVELPSDRWTLPTFRRDGLLLVAEEGADGGWRPRLVDIDSFEVTDPGFDFGPGVPVMQRYDGSGEWLLVLMADDPDAFPTIGRLLWFGPDGQRGEVPGEYISAAW
jgi:hypothetical protein